MDTGAVVDHKKRRVRAFAGTVPVLGATALALVLAACAPTDEPTLSTNPPTTVASASTTTVPVATATTDPVTSTTAATTAVDPMLTAVGDHSVQPFFTVAETIGSYAPIGVLDGLGAYVVDTGDVRLLVNHEVHTDQGATYRLSNGLELRGARIDFFDISVESRGVIDAGIAYDVVFDRTGSAVTSAGQINETGHATNGFDRFCSAQFIEAGTYGFIDDVYLTGEESKITHHPHGGSVWMLDVSQRSLSALPSLGRGVWENVTPIDTGDPATIGLLMGDDKDVAPLYLWIGQLHPEATGDGDVALRNGLVDGDLHVWVADTPAATGYDEFSGTGSVMAGRFVPIAAIDPSMAGEDGHDNAGYKDEDTLKREAFDDLGAFRFARPEDVATNPANGSQAVFAITGSDDGPDLRGGVYIVDISDAGSPDPKGVITILFDANDTADASVRNPDNLDWADDGYIYVQEDKANSEFGSESGRDASIYQIDPTNGDVDTLAVIDRSVIHPPGADDEQRNTLGAWESSGILDVSALFPSANGETLLVATVQAHSIRNGEIKDRGLVEGGQLVWIIVGQ